MDRLHFSARVRRRARRRRWLRRARVAGAIGTMAAIALGMPGSDASLDLIEQLGGAGDFSETETSESAAAMLRFRRRTFETRPSPAPSPSESETAPVASAGSSITEIVYDAAGEFGLSGDYLLSVAGCESGLNPNAYNGAGYYGLFQFDQQTWAAYGYGSIYDPVAQARTAARLLAAGQSDRWPNCA